MNRVVAVFRRLVGGTPDDKRIRAGGRFAILSRLSTRTPIEFAPPGPPISGVTSDDIDKDTGRPYPDYLERRRRRDEARTADDGEGQAFGAYERWK